MILKILLGEAKKDLDIAEEALRIAEAKYGLCSEEFRTVMAYYGSLKDEIRDLEKVIKQVETVNKLLGYS